MSIEETKISTDITSSQSTQGVNATRHQSDGSQIAGSKATSSDYIRGKFKLDDSWSNDKTVCYYQGSTMKVRWPLAKTIALIAMFVIMHFLIGLSLAICLVISLIVVTCFQYAVAHYMGYKAIPPMDQATFIGGSKAVVNYMNVTGYDVECDPEIVKSKFIASMDILPKFRYKIVEFAGDYYYQMMSVEETMMKGFIVGADDHLKTQDDLDKFAQDNVNQKLPLDGPLWRCYLQNFPSPDGKKEAIVVFKAHHSFGDGISASLIKLLMSEVYDRSYFIKTTDASFIEQMFVRFACIFQIPKLMFDNLQLEQDQNFITKNKQQRMNGKMNCQSTKEMKLLEIKELSKKLNLTINDVMTCAISTAFYQVFKEKGENIKQINVAIPANVRFKFYETRNDVKAENKFSAIPIVLPLCESMEQSYKPIKIITNKLKSTFMYIYAQYAITLYSQLLMPKSVCKLTLDQISSKFTVAFSNTPGAIKPLFFKGLKGEDIKSVWTQTYIIPSGYIGFAICAQSWVESFKVTVTSDNGLIDEEMNTRICRLIEQNVESEKIRMKDHVVPESKKDK